MKSKFDSPLESTKANLKEFPDINFNKGWIPEVFKVIPERVYAFVHIDVDLASPTIALWSLFSSTPRLGRGNRL
jgi:hypothetical protein